MPWSRRSSSASRSGRRPASWAPGQLAARLVEPGVRLVGGAGRGEHAHQLQQRPGRVDRSRAAPRHLDRALQGHPRLPSSPSCSQRQAAREMRVRGAPVLVDAVRARRSPARRLRRRAPRRQSPSSAAQAATVAQPRSVVEVQPEVAAQAPVLRSSTRGPRPTRRVRRARARSWRRRSPPRASPLSAARASWPASIAPLRVAALPQQRGAHAARAPRRPRRRRRGTARAGGASRPAASQRSTSSSSPRLRLTKQRAKQSRTSARRTSSGERREPALDRPVAARPEQRGRPVRRDQLARGGEVAGVDGVLRPHPATWPCASNQAAARRCSSGARPGSLRSSSWRSSSPKRW